MDGWMDGCYHGYDVTQHVAPCKGTFILFTSQICKSSMAWLYFSIIKPCKAYGKSTSCWPDQIKLFCDYYEIHNNIVPCRYVYDPLIWFVKNVSQLMYNLSIFIITTNLSNGICA